MDLQSDQSIKKKLYHLSLCYPELFPYGVSDVTDPSMIKTVQAFNILSERTPCDAEATYMSCNLLVFLGIARNTLRENIRNLFCERVFSLINIPR